MAKALLIPVDGDAEPISPANGQFFTMEELRTALNCDMVEVIDINSDGFIMLGDEESKLIAEPKLNVEATTVYRQNWGISNPQEQWAQHLAICETMGIIVLDAGDEPYTIAGTVIICPESMLK